MNSVLSCTLTFCLFNHAAVGCIFGPETTEESSGSSTSTGSSTSLRGDVATSEYKTGADGEAIKMDVELFCSKFDTSCSWRNSGDDQLEWSRGSGRADPQKWKFATGTEEMPSDQYMVLASSPTSADDHALMISDPINCQVGDGQVTFRHWTSRASSQSHRPKLNVCWRHVGERKLHDCGEVIGGPGPSTVVIPENLHGPFEIIFKGSNFVQAPQGGFLIVDDINYVGDVRKDCKNFEDPTTTPEDFTDYPSTDYPDDYDDDDTTKSNEATTDYPDYPDDNPDGRDNHRPDGDDITPDFSDTQSCVLASCQFDMLSDTCAYNPNGPGSRGPDGWKVTTGRENRVNPLTGVKYDKFRSREGSFAVATFPEPKSGQVDPSTHYVLESPELSFSKSQYLKFDHYLATAGTELKLCKNSQGTDCFWTSEPLIRGENNAKDNLKWKEDVVKMPAGDYKMHAIAAYDSQNVHNMGQVAVANFEFFSDKSAKKNLC